MRSITIAFGFLFLSASLYCQEEGWEPSYEVPCDCYCSPTGWAQLMNDEENQRPHRFTLGPEIYSVHREREKGSRQHGALYGVRGSYEYLKGWRFYIGVEGAWARGTLRGKQGTGDKIKSYFTDSMVEGRFGYTLQSSSGCCGWLTPFIGYGYFWENNDYTHPSPKSLHFRNRYEFISVGCLSRVCLAPRFYIGLNAEARFSMNGKVHVSNDPEGDPTILKYDQKVHCRVAVPLTYVCECFDWNISPFFEYRHYGRRYAFPFDFLDTRIKVYGADVQCTYKF